MQILHIRVAPLDLAISHNHLRTMASDSNAPVTPSLRTDRVRLAVLMAPKPGLSFEEFDRYWLDVHGNIFSSIAIAKRNLLKYEQVSPHSHRIVLSSTLSNSSSPCGAVPSRPKVQRNHCCIIPREVAIAFQGDRDL